MVLWYRNVYVNSSFLNYFYRLHKIALLVLSTINLAAIVMCTGHMTSVVLRSSQLRKHVVFSRATSVHCWRVFFQSFICICYRLIWCEISTMPKAANTFPTSSSLRQSKCPVCLQLIPFHRNGRLIWLSSNC